MRWMFNSNDRILRSTESKSTQCNNHYYTPLSSTNTGHNVYLDPFGDVDCINSGDDEYVDGDAQLSSPVEEIHSYSENDFFGEFGCHPAQTNRKVMPVEMGASEAEMSDFEQDTLSDSGISVVDRFAEILAKFDDILRDVDIVEGAINVNKANNVSKPCGKVYPFIQEVDVCKITEGITIEKEKIEECDGVSSDDVILVELLRHAWFVLMLYILIKVYFIII